jgi:hypothetical protein
MSDGDAGILATKELARRLPAAHAANRLFSVAASGDILRFLDGSEFRITRSAADTSGEFLEMQWSLPPSTETPPKHIHP